MPTTVEDPRDLLIAHLDFIRARVELIGRRHRLSRETVEELCSDLGVKLLDNDYEVLRRFRGEAKLTTYLAVVVDRFFLDWRTREWGSWRPHPVPHDGPVAQVERLIGRNGFSRSEALRMVAERHGAGGPSEEQLDDAVPVQSLRARPRLVGLTEAEESAATSGPSPEDALCAREAHCQIRDRLTSAMASLAARDRLLVKLHFGKGLTVAGIARTLGLRQRELYARIERALDRLRERLVAEGVTWADVREQLGRMERFPDPWEDSSALGGKPEEMHGAAVPRVPQQRPPRKLRERRRARRQNFP
jgi:RNA polymerase sigma factor (sigma-70 family)